MCEIQNIKCSEVTQNELKFAIYHTSDFLPFMQKLNIPHRHNYYMILLNEKKSGTQLIDFEERAIEPLSVTCLYYGQIHQWLNYDDIDGYILVFEDEFFALRHNNYQLSKFSFFSYRQELPYAQVDKAKFEHWKNIATWMLAEYNAKDKDFEKSIHSLLNLLLIDLNRLFEPSTINSDLKQSLQMIHHFEELIDKHFKEKHFVKDYAAMMYVNANYLNAVCKNVLQIAAGDLIRNRILLEAKRFLIHEKKTVAEIAYMLGFEDNSYFGRFFKKYENCTPDTFKKKYLNFS